MVLLWVSHKEVKIYSQSKHTGIIERQSRVPTMSIFKESDRIGNFKWSKKMLNKTTLSRHGGTYS